MTFASLSLGGSPADATIAIVPAPQHVEKGTGRFAINTKIVIAVDRGDDVRRVGEYLSKELERQVGISLRVGTARQLLRREAILLTTRPRRGGWQSAKGALPQGRGTRDGGVDKEHYELEVTADRVVLRAPTAEGLFRGVQTLRQLLPWRPEAEADAPPEKECFIPAVRIQDEPRYPWRGMHLDVCRHFMPVEFIKRYIDLLALHKFNTFHWHLTEDQGWRIEIKKYPKLTQVGAWRSEGDERYGGFYTQDEIRDIVAYAAERYINIVPEIEMPGHSLAALAAYPELSCTGGPFEVATKWGIYDDVYCAGNDKTFEFLKNVLDEVLALFPSETIHVGGDECPKTRWNVCPKCQQRKKQEGLADEEELQSYFMKRIARYLESKGRRLIGWDEILQGGLAPGATVMSWRGMSGGIKAAQSGHDVVMTPTTYCYFDYRQSDKADEPGSEHGPVLTLKTVYEFEPTPPELSPQDAKHVLGAQGNVWTEHMEDPQRVEYMTVPRMCALAEVTWSPRENRNWDDFLVRLKKHLSRLDTIHVHYRPLDD